MKRLIAFDLDGTLTQHRSPLGEENRRLLDALSEKYTLLMVGAGSCERIFRQMGGYPIRIIGNYGMQYAEYDGGLTLKWNESCPVDREECLRRAAKLRETYGLHDFTGETIEFHDSGMLTFPVLGTKAALEDKLQYDPDRRKRRSMYETVKELFHDYRVMIGGSSSFDIVPNRYGKLNALRRYMQDHHLTDEETVYVGDDYLPGGNDHDVWEGGIPFIRVDSHEDTWRLIEEYGLL